MHGWVVRNLRRSTRFWVRHRQAGERHIELTDVAVPFTPRRPDPPVRPVRTLLWLGGPGLLLAFFGMDRIAHWADTMIGATTTIAFLVVVASVLPQACSLFLSPTWMLLFSQGETDCASPENADLAVISSSEGRIEIDGLVRTGTPCHHLVPDLSITGGLVILSVDTLIQPGPCPLCLGKVEYRAVITELDPGAYSVRVRHGDRTIERAAVVVEERP